MRVSEVAGRYARALYAISQEMPNKEVLLNELRSLKEAFSKAPEIEALLESPLLSIPDLKAALAKVTSGEGFSKEAEGFVSVLIEKKRLSLLREIVQAYEDESDKANGVVRGSVKSPTPLKPEERKQIEGFVSKVTKKKVILDYQESPELIGGLVANVGSYSFDDSIDTQLKLLQEQIKRRSH